jgi:Ni/Co efflux regulator RcnB
MRQQQFQQQAQQRQAEQQQQAEGRARDFDRSRFQRGDRGPQQVTEQQQAQRSYRGYRGGYTGAQPQQVEQAQRSGSWSRDRGSWSRDRDGDFRQRSGDQQHYRDGSRWASGGWNRDWRRDHRYDWRSYRDRHRSVFHLGFYFDPFGYSYRPFDIGYRLPSLYFGQRYWIDAGMYQLPYPPPGTQWVRYWNDAVLVDMYSGEVVDVIRDFFW